MQGFELFYALVIPFDKLVCENHGNISGDISGDINGNINAVIDKSAQKIIELILKNPKITQDEIVDKIGLSKRTVSRIIKLLKDSGGLVREGSKQNDTAIRQFCAINNKIMQ